MTKDPSNLLSLIRFNEVTSLKNETKTFLSSRMRTDKFNKKQLIFSKGETCNKIFIIKKGMVHAFYQMDNQKITTWISIENEVFTSISSFFSGNPCLDNIQALEDTYVDYLTHEDMQEALSRFPDFVILNRRLMEEYYRHAEVRSVIPRIPGGKNRLKYFLDHYDKQIIERAPKNVLASLLNMRPETLSRLIP